MAATINGQLGTMLAGQSNPVKPHIKLQRSARLIDQQLIGFDQATVVFAPARPRSIGMRPLNSWMAFRSFYSRIFANMQQKDASPHLTKLWQQDPFKAKWAIIAKAYSIIRDAVGKVAAPLDLFLNQVCPEIGIISIDEYLHKMKWEFVTALDGMVSLQQTSAPDLSSFDERITRTVMTEWEVISFAENNGYMPRNTVVPNVQMTQQGVFAGFAGIPPPAPFANNNLAPVLSGMNMFLQDVAMNPAAAATMVLGFDVEDMLREPNTHQVKWTGSMADLYDPETGFLDLERNVENKWDVANIDDPQSFDSIFTDSIQDGYLIPNVPEFDGVNPDYL